jgi:hypothetical protein
VALLSWLLVREAPSANSCHLLEFLRWCDCASAIEPPYECAVVLVHVLSALGSV